MKHVLIVDDEESLLLTIQAGFEAYKARFTVITARNGVEASAILAATRIDLVLTDLKMPEMDGFGLLAILHNNYPEIPAIVMTAFATPEIEERLSRTAMIRMLEKPVDFDELTQLILGLIDQDFSGGTLTGISLPSFLQLIEMEQKTCLMEVKADDGQQGLLYFEKGVLYDAVLEKEKGEEAACRMLLLDNVRINFRSLPSKKLKRRIETNLMNLLMESARRKDEMDASKPEPDPGPGDSVIAQPATDTTSSDNRQAEPAPGAGMPDAMKGDRKMADIKQTLEKFKAVEGFQAVGAFSPNGEMVAEVNVAGLNLAELGSLANDVLLKAQKATDIMNVGRGQLVHVEAPKAHIIARCLNEATDFAATASGRAHVHMVLILAKDGNLAMAKMKVASVIQELAEYFR